MNEYLVDMRGDAGTGDGFEMFATYAIEAPHEDAAIEAAFEFARKRHPNIGDLNLGWVRMSV